MAKPGRLEAMRLNEAREQGAKLDELMATMEDIKGLLEETAALMALKKPLGQAEHDLIAAIKAEDGQAAKPAKK
jgi:hypothetical protein